jgi:hypothetical protein
VLTAAPFLCVQMKAAGHVTTFVLRVVGHITAFVLTAAPGTHEYLFSSLLINGFVLATMYECDVTFFRTISRLEPLYSCQVAG